MSVFGQNDPSLRKLQLLGFTIQTFNGAEAITPPLCYIASGDFLMGSSPQRDSDTHPSEEDEHWVRLDAYQIAKYPVTVREYACFVNQGGTPPETRTNVSWSVQLQHPDHPVVCVRWIDAHAYTEWLRDTTGQAWRLPTEAEWEKAARWDYKKGKGEARIYPWGNKFDKRLCNTSASAIGTTTEIDRYPQGASPYGAYEMAGNVWEWTTSIFSSYPYDPTDGREDPTSDKHRVLRGGAWLLPKEVARCACRNSEHPRIFVGHFIDVGFRLLLD
ncbi:MAG TPA: SUMF1/EgtB/PvdO family nonheme iron enzyme [Ktedonobacteraceae bacterium]